ncbi:hypothetical protein [Sulfurimonas sp.]|jgi:thioredoxin-related protein|uniref:hypothetical protein n=1 Tax=Sulfurimonas sp. TaxID=2022749 RepID=UPI0025DE982A|nr:hypothetical protein [Sulfurimonas sp.]MCK9473666.1 hypothetical protein [Sulfurimonas sp.]
MKRVLLFFIFALNLFASTPVLNLNGIYFYDVKEVLNYSNSKDRRKLFLLFSSEKCSSCVSFKNKLASLDSDTKNSLNSRFIFAIVEDEAKMFQMFQIKSTPTTFVMTQDKKFVIAPMVGEPIDISLFIDYLFKISEIQRNYE